MNEFLKNREQVNQATRYLEENNLITSGLDCKNWEAVQVIPFLKDGNLIDLGSSGGIILENAVALNLSGRKVGVDLAYTENEIKNGVELFKSDLMSTNFGEETFDIVTCLSVIEHEVSISKFAQECSRIMKHGAQLFVSFDYWPKKINTKGVLLYNLTWNILDVNEAWFMINAFINQSFELAPPEIDWTIQDAVIDKNYCAPADVAYTFGIFNFIKK